VGLAGDVLDLSEKYPVKVVEQFIDSICSLYGNFVKRDNLEYSQSVKRIREMSRSHIQEELILLGHYL
jgi:spore cortex formation protein SpoVR/YcgB (stage V sporulation)